MSGVQLRAVFDDAPVRAHLARLAALDARGFGGVRREIGEFMLGDIQDNLDGQKLFDGSPMKQSKAAIKRRGKTLIHRHHLYDSYVYQLQGLNVAVGSNSIYARIHHEGGDTGRGGKTHIDPRPVMGMTERHEARIGQIVIDELRRLQ